MPPMPVQPVPLVRRSKVVPVPVQQLPVALAVAAVEVVAVVPLVAAVAAGVVPGQARRLAVVL